MPNASQIMSGAKPDGVIESILAGSAKMAAELNSPEQEDVAKKVGELYQKAKAYKANWSKDHDRWWNLWEGNHYKHKRATTLQQAIVNQVYSAIETFVAHILEGINEPLAKSRVPQFVENAKLATKWLRYTAQVNDLGVEIEHSIRSACVTGCGWLAVEWDEQASNGKGEVAIIPVDDKYIFPAPYARNVKEMLYLIEAKNIPRDFAVANWPEKGPAVPPGTWDGSVTNTRSYNAPTDMEMANVASLTTTDGADSSLSRSRAAVGGQRKNDLVTLIKCYIRQQDTRDVSLTVVANGVVLQDGPSPYGDREFPYVPVNILPTLDTVQGRGLAQFVEGLQQVLNDSLSYILDQQRFSSDPMMIVDSENLEEASQLENQPGAVLPNASQRGQGYAWLQAPGFNQAWLQVQEIVANYMDSVLGRVDILKGERPAGVDTLGGLEIIRDEANIRLRKHIRWVKASMKRVYKLSISRLRQFASGERIIRLSDPITGVDQFETMNPAGSPNPLTGAMQSTPTLPDEAEFDIEFGQDLPGGRQAEIELALNLAATPAEDGLPMVDRQYVLEKCRVEDMKAVMARLAAIGMQQQAAMQQQGGGGQPGAQPTPEQQAAQNMSPADAIAEIFGGA